MDGKERPASVHSSTSGSVAIGFPAQGIMCASCLLQIVCWDNIHFKQDHQRIVGVVVVSVILTADTDHCTDTL